MVISSSPLSSASDLLHLLGSQTSTRLVSFAINVLIARILPPGAYGLSSIQFHLLMTTIFQLSREGFRRGCLRFDHTSLYKTVNATTPEQSSDQTLKKTCNTELKNDLRILRVAWLTVPLGVLVTMLVCVVSIGIVSLGNGDNRAIYGGVPLSTYRTAVVLHGAAAIIELLGEPFYILAAVHFQFQIRAIIDAASLTLRGIVTLVLLVSYPSLSPAIVFSLAQVSLSVAVAAAYNVYGFRKLYGKQGLTSSLSSAWESLHRFRLSGWDRGQTESLWLSYVFALQSIQKLVLGEGSKFVFSAFTASLHGVYASLAAALADQQGVYGLVGGLGGVVVRCVFAPIEDIAFSSWSRRQRRQRDEGEDEGEDAKKPKMEENSSSSSSPPFPSSVSMLNSISPPPLSPPPPLPLPLSTTSLCSAKSSVSSDFESLALAVRALTLIGLILASFGPNYSYALLRLIYGSRWADRTSAPAVLAFYSSYTALLAVNGLLEAFTHATMDEKALKRSNVIMLCTAILHLGLCMVAVHPEMRWAGGGALGMVAADSVNMACRIGYSLLWIHRHFQVLFRGGQEEREAKGKLQDATSSFPSSFLSPTSPLSLSSSPSSSCSPPSSPPNLRDLLPRTALLLVFTLACFITALSERFFFGCSVLIDVVIPALLAPPPALLRLFSQALTSFSSSREGQWNRILRSYYPGLDVAIQKVITYAGSYYTDAYDAGTITATSSADGNNTARAVLHFSRTLIPQDTVMTRLSTRDFLVRAFLPHVCVGVVLLVILGGVFWKCEREMVQMLRGSQQTHGGGEKGKAMEMEGSEKKERNGGKNSETTRKIKEKGK